MSTQRKTHEVGLDSGFTIIIAPLSPYARIAFNEEAKRLFPDVDGEPYKRRLANAPEGVEAFEPLEENPDYLKATERVYVQRLNYLYDAVIRSGVVEDAIGGKQVIIEQCREQLKKIRKYAADVPEDDWLATVMMCLIATKEDCKRIVDAAQDILTPGEVAIASQGFRGDIQRGKRDRDHRKQAASGIPS